MDHWIHVEWVNNSVVKHMIYMHKTLGSNPGTANSKLSDYREQLTATGGDTGLDGPLV